MQASAHDDTVPAYLLTMAAKEAESVLKAFSELRTRAEASRGEAERAKALRALRPRDSSLEEAVPHFEPPSAPSQLGVVLMGAQHVAAAATPAGAVYRLPYLHMPT